METFGQFPSMVALGLKTRAGETGTIRNCHCKSLLICHLICHCELLLWHVVYYFVSNLKWWNIRN